MQSFRLAINYNGRWNDLDYVDGKLIGEWVENKLSYNELVEMTYRLTEIDRSIYDIILYGVIKLRSRWKKYRMKRDNDIDFIFHDDSSIKEIYIDMEKRVGGGTCAGGDTHVHKLPPSFFKYDNVGCYTIDSDNEDEKPNEHNYPSSSDDTFIGVEQGTGVEDGIGGTKNCGGTGWVTFGGLSHDPFPAAPSRWILPCVVQPIDYTKYAVKDNEGKVWTIDLELRTCTYRKFDLDMLPCAHAIAVCRHTRVPKERLCSDYFTTQWLQTAYAPSIHPVPYPSSWVLPERVSSCVVHPPEGRRQSSRPKKIRICSSLEGPETRVCTNCEESGHNRITCTKPRQARSISKSSSSSIGQKPPFRRQCACGRYGLLGHNIQTCSNLEEKP
ncbi:hypothetical protein Ddye_013403 [Dipteronia dyeriana]|uniref:SWIM-type domain-containing protein n=1 Tax=Dipteronia dyeriana TaxID=168575 RepID=A0AAE0CJK0_9ROSI|nr:hypothetical protein Ddye_013403 [Dipteronia dyeriana]